MTKQEIEKALKNLNKEVIEYHHGEQYVPPKFRKLLDALMSAEITPAEAK